mgnify:CR=1 FL=1
MNVQPHKLLTALLLILVACSFSIHVEATTYDGVHQLVARRFPFMVGKVAFQPLVGTNEEAFELQTQGKRLVVKATSPSAAAGPQPLPQPLLPHQHLPMWQQPTHPLSPSAHSRHR